MPFIVGCAIGLVIVMPILWRYRVEIKQTWQDALGISSEKYVTEGESDNGRPTMSDDAGGRRVDTRWLPMERRACLPRRRRVAIGLLLATSIVNTCLAITVTEEKAIYVVGAVLFGLGAGLLWFTTTEKGYK